MRWWIGGLLVLLAVGQAKAQADGALSQLERDAAYCLGATSERHGGYLFECRAQDKPEDCRFAKELAASEAWRKPIFAYIERQGLGPNGNRSQADKLELAKVSGRGAADYRNCLGYFTRIIESCFISCSKSNGPKCLQDCQAKDAQACVRLEFCADPLAPLGKASP